ncbi:MAG: SRPBCC family protein, partial [Candidatus Kariarchaeaceae archaeon]
ADLEGYVNYTSLIRTDLVQTDNDTIVRECEDSRGSWRETQVDYTTNESYTMEVDTSDYPYPFRYFAGTWSVKEIEGKTEISMTFSWVPKGWIFGKLVFAFLLPGMIRKGVTQTIEKYEQRIIANRSVALQDRSRLLNPISSLANT